jgi:hypothetical protein
LKAGLVLITPWQEWLGLWFSRSCFTGAVFNFSFGLLAQGWLLMRFCNVLMKTSAPLGIMLSSVQLLESDTLAYFRAMVPRSRTEWKPSYIQSFREMIMYTNRKHYCSPIYAPDRVN